MIEQLSLDMMISDEQRAFDLAYPVLKDIIFNAPMDAQILVFQELENCSSVYFLDTNEIFFRIRLRKKSRYISISNRYEDLLPPDTIVSRVMSEAGMVRIAIQTCEDILKYVPVLRAVLERICRNHRDFGCCSRYEACSDAKTCVHPDPKFALGCWYQQNLLEGKIFYGKNKTVN